MHRMDDELARLLAAQEAHPTPTSAPESPSPRRTEAPIVDPAMEMHWRATPAKPRRERWLVVRRHAFRVDFTQFIVSPHERRLHELPDPLQKQFVFILAQMKAFDVDQLTYRDEPATDVSVAEHLPDEIRHLVAKSINAFHDAAWYVEYYWHRGISRDHQKPWHCLDCGADVPHTKRWCDAAGCQSRETYARVTGEQATAVSTQPETPRARRAR